MVLVTTPAQPASKARRMLLSDSVGGAEERRKGFSKRIPVKSTERSMGMANSCGMRGDDEAYAAVECGANRKERGEKPSGRSRRASRWHLARGSLVRTVPWSPSNDRNPPRTLLCA